jgi:preprotein translocase subunit SecA
MVSFGVLARKLFGSSNERRIRGMRPRVDAINALEPELQALTDAELQGRTDQFRKQIADGASFQPSRQYGKPRGARSGCDRSTCS